MANDRNEKNDSTTLEALTNAITSAIKQGQPAPVESPEAYLARKRALDPTHQLTRPVFQNGQPIQIKGASTDTVRHLNAMQPGEYFDGDIRVELHGKAPYEQLHINYTFPFSDRDRRMAFYMKVSSFSDMVQKIARQQAADASE